MTSRAIPNPRTFEWEWQEFRGSTQEYGPDGFIAITPTEFPQIVVEATLRFEGRDLKGYTAVFDVEKQDAPLEVRLDGCNTAASFEFTSEFPDIN